MLGLLEIEIYDSIVLAWAVAALIAVGLLGITLFGKALLLRRLPEPRPTGDLGWREVLRELVIRTWTLFLIIAAVYAGASVLNLPRSVDHLILSAFVVALFVQLAIWVDQLVSALLAWRLARTKVPIRNALSLIQFLLRVVVWSIALLLIFENLGFNVTALVAGLGIGGVAVALAAQNVLGDLFSSLAIVLDRPFEVGDFIVFDDQNGTVEKIGIKTTRLRSLSGEQIICANSDLLGSRIHNYKRMAERRVLFTLAVTYDTQANKLERIPPLLQKIIEAQELTRFERAHFKALGDSALNFEIVYWVLSPDQNTYMDIQQGVNLEILRAFGRESIEFAYPTRTLLTPHLKEALSTAALASERPRLRSSAGSH